MSEYTDSKAFVGRLDARGTTVKVNGKVVGEVTDLTVSKSVALTANYVIDDSGQPDFGQQEIMENHKVPVSIEISNAFHGTLFSFYLPIDYWYIHFDPCEAVKLYVLFRRPDSAVEDGPEVNAILKERAGELVEGSTHAFKFPGDWLRAMFVDASTASRRFHRSIRQPGGRCKYHNG